MIYDDKCNKNNTRLKTKKKRKDIPYYEWQKYFNNYKIYVLIKCKYDTYV